MSVFPSSQATIDLQVLPTFPANVVATGAVDISKSGLTYTFGLNFQNVIEETSVSDMSKREVLVQDTDTGAFWRVKLSSLPTGQTDWANIQNKPTEFPPSPHTHPVAEISDATVIGQSLVTAADAAAACAAIGAVNKAGDAMTGPLRVPTTLFVDAGSSIADAHLRLCDETGVSRGTVYWDRALDQVWLALHDATGALVNSIRLSATGAAVNGDAVWTDGNKQIADGQVLGNVSGSTGVPVGVTLSALLDKISNTRGAVLYRGASGWAALGAGAAGQVLTSGGAGADPSWQSAAAVAVDPWECVPIGVPIPVFDHIPGVFVPPTNKGYRYVNLTAGLTGAGQYNEGILTNESVSGSAPLITATAEIDLPSSPLHGQTIPLINTERRFIRAGSVGTVQDDAFQGHWHVAVNNSLRYSPTNASSGGVVTSHQADGVNSDASWIGVRSATTDGSNGTPRVANETRPRNIGAKYFMRIL